MTNLPLTLRQRLKEIAYITRLNVRSRNEGKKGTVSTAGNLRQECHRGCKNGISIRLTVLFIADGCKWHAPLRIRSRGFVRNLSAGEIVDEALRIQEDVTAFGANVGNIVLMGTGEPLDNYEPSIKALRILNAKSGLGISFRRMTVSTCGLVPGILRLAEEEIPVTLSVSLHAPTDDVRETLMPINRRYSIVQLMDAAAYYRERTGRRVTFEYALIRDINDSDRHAYQLVDLLREQSGHVNLIPLNPIDEKE